MSEASLAAGAGAPTVSVLDSARLTSAAIAWRNLWRNKRRTWLMAAGIGFVGLLVMLINSLQVGAFETMIDNSARFFAGHLQVQHPDYADEPRTGRVVGRATARVAALEARSEFGAVAPRGQAFALLSAGAGSATAEPPALGGLVVGVDPSREFALNRRMAATGRYLSGPREAYVGAILANNLGVAVGDEIVVLGSSARGSVAAMALTVVGTFSTGQTAFDRSQVHVRLDAFQEAFGLVDEVNAIALLIADQAAAPAVAAGLGDGETVAVPWQELLPDIHQLAELKYQSTYMIYALLVVLVTFSVVNGFIMVTYERTPEFGMLKALGMTPAAVMGMLSWEALWMAALGLAVVFTVAVPLIGLLAATGISFGDDYAQVMARYLMPERLYPTFGWRAAVEFSVVMLVATQLAALIPALRLRRLSVVDALRAED